jgi:hypothetical protein
MIAQRHFSSSTELCEHIRTLSGETVILSFSCGKDSIAAWWQLRRHFSRIIPVYLYRIPGLRFVEERLVYYEQALGAPILRLPHPALSQWLRLYVFQPPQRCAAIDYADVPKVTYEDIEAHVRRRVPGAAEAWIADGVRGADSALRRLAIRKNGVLNERRRKFHCVYDWTMDDLGRALQESCIRLPVDYRLFGVSFDGIGHQFLAPLREHYPEDYAQILRFFPLAELEIRRHAWSPHSAVQTDAEYWICFCYPTGAERARVAALIGDAREVYFDGLALAAKLGVTIATPSPPILPPKIRTRFLPYVG